MILSCVNHGSQFSHQGICVSADMALPHLLRASRFVAHFLEGVRIIAQHHIRIRRVQYRLKPCLQLFCIFAG
jgi:hypothetical protein